MPTAPVRGPLWAALALLFVFTAALIIRVPFNAAPDEAAHAQYIAAIATNHALTVFAGQPPPQPGYEFHQPPLFYLLAAPLWAALPAGARMGAARWLSLLFGLLTLVVVWGGANLLFGRGSRASAVCVLLAALSPLHQGVSAGINNDALAGLWAALLFYLVARAWLEEPTKRLVLLVGLVAGLGALTKLTALPLGAWAFLALGAALAKRGERPLTALLPGMGVALLLAAPMFLRNQMLYGDPLAYGLFSRAATLGTPGFAFYAANFGWTFFRYARGLAWQILLTAWGFFGGPNTLNKMTRPFSAGGPGMPSPLWLLPLLVVVGVPLMAVWGGWKARPDKAAPETRALSAWWGAGVLLLVLLWANFALGHISAGQARYLHGALLPVTLLLGGQLARTRTGMIPAGALFLTMAGLSLANILGWRTLV